MHKHITHPRHAGFTLIEMAIVLVVIGLILGMVFKGRQLIDQGRVKSLAAQHAKIIGALNTFYDRYGFYPGDGCLTTTPASPMACTGTRNGYLNGNNEIQSFWYLLSNITGILNAADRISIFGQPWNALQGNTPVLDGNETLWLDLPGNAQADKRIACALDQMIDDGNPNDGIVVVFGGPYSRTSDCWSLSGQVNIHLKVLP